MLNARIVTDKTSDFATPYHTIGFNTVRAYIITNENEYT